MLIPNKSVIYEFPIDERLRYFLRYEDIMHKAEHYLSLKDDVAVLKQLRRLLDFTGNHDLRSELLHQLEQQKTTLRRFESANKINFDKLQKHLNGVEMALERMHAFRMPQSMYNSHEFLTTAMRQISLQSGLCSFDFPQLQVWRQRSWRDRNMELMDWLSPFREFATNVALSLELTRKSGDFTRNKANDGCFTNNPEHQLARSVGALKMVRVKLAIATCYPIMSAGTQLLTIHFMHQGSFAEQPGKTDNDVNFEIAYCSI